MGSFLIQIQAHLIEGRAGWWDPPLHWDREREEGGRIMIRWDEFFFDPLCLIRAPRGHFQENKDLVKKRHRIWSMELKKIIQKPEGHPVSWLTVKT